MQHEIGHALFHGSPEFYTFKFTTRLQEVARINRFDIFHLQQCVYYLSIATKDWEVIQWLTKIGLGQCQKSLLEYLMNSIKEEQEAWAMTKHSPVMKKIAMAAFLKVILPIEGTISIGFEDAQTLKKQWKEAYCWLSIVDRDGLLRLSQWIIKFGGSRFQEKLESAANRLMEDF